MFGISHTPVCLMYWSFSDWVDFTHMAMFSLSFWVRTCGCATGYWHCYMYYTCTCTTLACFFIVAWIEGTAFLEVIGASKKAASLVRTKLTQGLLLFLSEGWFSSSIGNWDVSLCIRDIRTAIIRHFRLKMFNKQQYSSFLHSSTVWIQHE